MTRWTQEEEEKLLELYERNYTYEEMAEALPGRSVGAVRGKLGGRKREKREDTYIGGRGSAHTEKSPLSFSQSLNDVVLSNLLSIFQAKRDFRQHKTSVMHAYKISTRLYDKRW